MIRTRAVPVMAPRFRIADVRSYAEHVFGLVTPESSIRCLEERLAPLAPNARVVARGRDAMAALLDVCTDRAGEVIVPAYTDASVYDTIAASGHRPVLADVRIDDGNIDPDAVEELLTEHTVAIVATHLYGHPCDLDKLGALGVPLIEDAAHALGARFDGRPVGGFGVGAFTSFAPFKVVQAHGGGAAWSHDPRIARALDVRLGRPATAGARGPTKLASHAALSFLSRSPVYDLVVHPMSSAATRVRVDPKGLYKRWVRPFLKRGADDARPIFSGYQAAIALRELEGIEPRRRRRVALAERLRAACAHVVLTRPRGGRTSSELMLAAYAHDPASTIAALHREGVGALRSPMSDLFSREERSEGTVSGWIDRHAVLLPLNADLGDRHAKRIIDALHATRTSWIEPSHERLPV